MSHRRIGLVLAGLFLGAAWTNALGDAPKGRYFGHGAVEDRFGVIAPWYDGQNGQCDFRVRIAAETLKRYPWADKPLAVVSAPHFVFNGHWGIQPEGTIRGTGRRPPRAAKETRANAPTTATPPSRGMGTLWTFRSFGRSIAPSRAARRFARGVSPSDRAAAARLNALRSSAVRIAWPSKIS